MSSNKRMLETKEPEHTERKRRKFEGSEALSFVNKMTDTITDERINDTTFVVGIGDNSEIIHGVAFLFASHSDIFRNMLCGSMSESTNKQVIINDITIEAFKYIKEYTHLGNPTLEFENVIDILYAAQKYMIADMVKQCTKKIQSMKDIDTFYLIMNAMSAYAPSTFDYVLTEIIQKRKCRYLHQNIMSIVLTQEARAKFNKLHLFQVRLLVQLIKSSFDKYNVIKSFCTANTNDGDGWQSYFEKYFVALMNFENFTAVQLMEIRSDQILKLEKLLPLLDQKIKRLADKKDSFARKYQREQEELASMTHKWKRRGDANSKLRKEIKSLQQQIYELQQNQMPSQSLASLLNSPQNLSDSSSD